MSESIVSQAISNGSTSIVSQAISDEISSENLIYEPKEQKENSDKQPFDFLKDINDWLEAVPIRITNAFENMTKGQELVQEKIDVACKWLAWKVNIAVESVRQRLIKALWQMYRYTVVGKVMQMMLVIKKFMENPLYYLFKFALEIFAPYYLVIKWYQTLLTEIPRLAQNLAKIAQSLPPKPPSIDINFNAFAKELSIKSISISDITNDPNNLPLPEAMFPEPEKPFTNKTFDNVFLNVSAKLKSNKMVYKLGDKDKQALLFSSDKGSTSTIA